MRKRKRASKFEAETKIQEIRDLHVLGCKALQLHPGLSIADQASELGCTAATLGVARRFAFPTTGYSEERLNELCALILKHLPVFGTSHVEILLAIPWPDRKTFELKCIKRRWSRRTLIAMKTKHFKPKSKGGRRPQITPADAVVQLEDYANAFCRLFAQMKKHRDTKPSILDGLSDQLRESVETAYTPMRNLRRDTLAHLKTTQS